MVVIRGWSLDGVMWIQMYTLFEARRAAPGEDFLINSAVFFEILLHLMQVILNRMILSSYLHDVFLNRFFIVHSRVWLFNILLHCAVYFSHIASGLLCSHRIS